MPRNASGWCRPANANASATQKRGPAGPLRLSQRRDPIKTSMRQEHALGCGRCGANRRQIIDTSLRWASVSPSRSLTSERLRPTLKVIESSNSSCGMRAGRCVSSTSDTAEGAAAHRTLILFGADEHCTPRAARFSATDPGLLATAGLVDPVFKALRKQRHLPAISSLNEALHPMPPQVPRITAARISRSTAFSHSQGHSRLIQRVLLGGSCPLCPQSKTLTIT